MENQLTKLNKEKLILPVIILSACIILGGFYYASQVSKQKSIERQQQVKIEEERRAEEAKIEEARKIETKEETARQECFNEAGKRANEFLQTKADMAKNDTQKKEYEEAIANGLHLRADFDRFNEDCLSKKGLEKK